MIIQRCGSFQGYKDVKVVYIKRLFFLISIQEERKKIDLQVGWLLETLVDHTQIYVRLCYIILIITYVKF